MMKSPVDDAVALKAGQRVGKTTRRSFCGNRRPEKAFHLRQQSNGREAMYFGIGGLVLLIIILILLFR